eukprot:GHVN01075244.1.p1 GENE.GHVN01075244.1~~GHVN01075244.1.p1  ORF type:complete len:226 (-),score=77.77 GHVN01075244.1:33-650(-)
MTTNHQYTVSDLVRRVERGDEVRYLFFWGHTPHSRGHSKTDRKTKQRETKTGGPYPSPHLHENESVGKECLSQWWPHTFTADAPDFLLPTLPSTASSALSHPLLINQSVTNAHTPQSVTHTHTPQSFTHTHTPQSFTHTHTPQSVRFRSAEHYMMAEKARLFNDTKLIQVILDCQSPAEAKKMGREAGHQTMYGDTMSTKMVYTG